MSAGTALGTSKPSATKLILCPGEQRRKTSDGMQAIVPTIRCPDARNGSPDYSGLSFLNARSDGGRILDGLRQKLEAERRRYFSKNAVAGQSSH